MSEDDPKRRAILSAFGLTEEEAAISADDLGQYRLAELYEDELGLRAIYERQTPPGTTPTT